MEEVITINGKTFTNKKFLRTLMYGEGVFETFRYKGKFPKTLKMHFDRLIKGAKFLNIPPISYEEFIKCIKDTVDKFPNKEDLYIKTILVSQGDLYYPSNPKSSNLITIVKDFKGLNKENIDIILAPFKVHSSDPVLKIKSTNFVQKVIAKRYALKKGFFDALFLNENNEITETTSANIFWIKGKYMYTPSVDCGLLNGITRQIVIKKAKNEGFVVIEGRFYIDEIKDADYIFITNSLLGIKKVSKIEFNIS